MSVGAWPVSRRLNNNTSQLTGLRAAIDSADLPTAIALCEEALSLRPRHELASSLLAEAHRTVAREQRRQAVWLQRVLDRVALAIDGAEFSAAHSALKEAELLKPEAPEVDDLRRRLTEAESPLKPRCCCNSRSRRRFDKPARHFAAGVMTKLSCSCGRFSTRSPRRAKSPPNSASSFG